MGNLQTVTTLRDGVLERFELPNPRVEILPGVCWGRFEQFFTPAFWRARLWIDGESSPLVNYRIGSSLREEIAACLLGGFGMPAEVGLAAFERLRNRGLLEKPDAVQIERALSEPLDVGRRRVKYRYPGVKSRYLSAAMERLNWESAPDGGPRALRHWLLSFDGVGLKTASWITRNFMHSDEVAILDVHVIRAGLLMGLFSSTNKIPRDYLRMEDRLVAFARGLGVKLSRFDSMLWCYMRRLSGLAIDSLGGPAVASNLA